MQQIFDPKLFAAGLVQTPGGLAVTPRTYEEMVKAEARRLRAAEQATRMPVLFSPYQLMANMQVYGAREKPQGTPNFDELYLSADKSFIDKIIIQARVDQSKMVWQKAIEGRQVGYKVVHDRHDDPQFKPTKDIQDRCNEMEKVLNDPSPEKYTQLYPHQIRVHNSLKDFIARVVRSELIIDRKVIYRFKRRDGKGYAAFHWLPGESIKPVHEGVKEWARKVDPAGRMNQRQLWDRMSAMSGVDLYECSHVQMADGMIVYGFRPDEISLHIANPSDRMNRFGYGESRLEMSLDVTNTLLYAWNYNRELFKTNYPEAVLTVSGDFDKDGLEAFKKQLNAETSGPGGSWRLPVISSTPGADLQQFQVNATKLRDTPKDMLFDQFIRLLINIKAAAYGAHPSIINFSMEGGGGDGGSLFGRDQTSEIEFSKEHGFRPHLMDMCEWLTDAIVKPTYDDLRLMISGLDDNDEKTRQEIFLNKGKNYLTKNEMRKSDNLEPIGDVKDDKNPWNYPADAPVATYLTTMQSMQMQEQQMQEQQQGQDAQNPWSEDSAYNEDDSAGDQNPWGDDQQDQDGEDQEQLGKSQREVKFLRITLS